MENETNFHTEYGLDVTLSAYRKDNNISLRIHLLIKKSLRLHLPFRAFE